LKVGEKKTQSPEKHVGGGGPMKGRETKGNQRGRGALTFQKENSENRVHRYLTEKGTGARG